VKITAGAQEADPHARPGSADAATEGRTLQYVFAARPVEAFRSGISPASMRRPTSATLSHARQTASMKACISASRNRVGPPPGAARTMPKTGAMLSYSPTAVVPSTLIIAMPRGKDQVAGPAPWSRRYISLRRTGESGSGGPSFMRRLFRRPARTPIVRPPHPCNLISTLLVPYHRPPPPPRHSLLPYSSFFSLPSLPAAPPYSSPSTCCDEGRPSIGPHSFNISAVAFCRDM